MSLPAGTARSTCSKARRLVPPDPAEYLLDPASGAFGIEPEEPHRALAEALDSLAPMAEHRPEDPLHRYAAVREAEHPWVIGEHVRAIDSLEGRELLTPAENLDRWQRWHEQGRTVLGPDHRETLRTQSEIARWTGETGNPREALRLLQRLLSDQSA